MIELLPLIEIAISFAVVVLTAVGGYALNAIAKRFNINVDESMNQRINEAIEYGAGIAVERLKEKNIPVTISHKNEFVVEAANYVIKGVPKALLHFGLTEERVREMVESRLAGKLPADPVVSEGVVEPEQAG